MTREQLIGQVKLKKSCLCIGLDTDINKIPKHLQSHPDAQFKFNKAIIDATKDLCVAYKINTAFYEAMGLKGWEAMESTVHYLGDSHFKIADAKRGDIGNTSAQYAKAFFETIPFNAITVVPYMGEDSIRPFLEFKNKWTIVLGLTSNEGSKDFEQLHVTNNENYEQELLYQAVIKKVSRWGDPANLMFVAGATKAADFEAIRKIIPDHFLLVPGVGSQGGSLAEVSRYGLNKECGLLVNASRAVIYAGNKENFAEEARMVAQQYQHEMSEYLQEKLRV